MIGQTLGSYRIVEQIGAGGMATVFKAYDPGTDRYVAIKTLPQQYSNDPQFAARFEIEARAIAKLEHLHILPVFAYGEDNGISYMAMRLLETGTLKELMESAQLSFAEIGRLLKQFAGALDYAHSQQIIHRDVKPGNALIDNQGNLYLTDFGIAKMVENMQDLTGTGILGTPRYMSPEQCMGARDVGAASDQYALGVVLYEMLTGQTPYEGETPAGVLQNQILGSPLPPPRSLRKDIPEGIEQVVLKALSREPDERYESCMALSAAYDRALHKHHADPTKEALHRPDDQRETLVFQDDVELMPDTETVHYEHGMATSIKGDTVAKGETVTKEKRSPRAVNPMLPVAGVLIALASITIGYFVFFQNNGDDSQETVASSEDLREMAAQTITADANATIQSGTEVAAINVQQTAIIVEAETGTASVWTDTATPTVTYTPSATPTASHTPTITPTFTITPTNTATAIPVQMAIGDFNFRGDVGTFGLIPYNSKRIVPCSDDETSICLWNASTNIADRLIADDSSLFSRIGYQDFTGASWSPDGDFLYIGIQGTDGAQLWQYSEETQELDPLFPELENVTYIEGVHGVYGNQFLILADQTVYLTTMPDGELTEVYSAQSGSCLRNIQFSPNLTDFVVWQGDCDAEGSIGLNRALLHIELATGNPQRLAQVEGDDCNDYRDTAYHAAGEMVIFVDGDCRSYLVTIASGEYQLVTDFPYWWHSAAFPQWGTLPLPSFSESYTTGNIIIDEDFEDRTGIPRWQYLLYQSDASPGFEDSSNWEIQVDDDGNQVLAQTNVEEILDASFSPQEFADGRGWVIEFRFRAQEWRRDTGQALAINIALASNTGECSYFFAFQRDHEFVSSFPVAGDPIDCEFSNEAITPTTRQFFLSAERWYSLRFEVYDGVVTYYLDGRAITRTILESPNLLSQFELATPQLAQFDDIFFAELVPAGD